MSDVETELALDPFPPSPMTPLTHHSCFFVPWAWFHIDQHHPLASSHGLLGSGHLRQTRIGTLADRIFLEQNAVHQPGEHGLG